MTNTSSSYYLPYHTDLHYQELHFAMKTKQYTDNCSHNKINLLPSYKASKMRSKIFILSNSINNNIKNPRHKKDFNLIIKQNPATRYY